MSNKVKHSSPLYTLKIADKPSLHFIMLRPFKILAVHHLSNWEAAIYKSIGLIILQSASRKGSERDSDVKGMLMTFNIPSHPHPPTSGEKEEKKRTEHKQNFK